jgi:hypothetical protein
VKKGTPKRGERVASIHLAAKREIFLEIEGVNRNAGVHILGAFSPYFAIVQEQWKLRFIAAVKRRPPRSRGAAFLL